MGVKHGQEQGATCALQNRTRNVGGQDLWSDATVGRAVSSGGCRNLICGRIWWRKEPGRDMKDRLLAQPCQKKDVDNKPCNKSRNRRGHEGLPGWGCGRPGAAATLDAGSARWYGTYYNRHQTVVTAWRVRQPGVERQWRLRRVSCSATWRCVDPQGAESGTLVNLVVSWYSQFLER